MSRAHSWGSRMASLHRSPNRSPLRSSDGPRSSQHGSASAELFRPSSARALSTGRYEAESARAYDRLYDELYSVLLSGNPRIPIDLDDAIGPAWGPTLLELD